MFWMRFALSIQALKPPKGAHDLDLKVIGTFPSFKFRHMLVENEVEKVKNRVSESVLRY
jgi:hypothetical protein